MHLAVSSCPVEIVQLLLDHGADPNSQRRHDGARPLHCAIQRTEKKDSGAIAWLLFEAGADPNCKLRDSSKTMIEMACKHNNAEVLEMLLQLKSPKPTGREEEICDRHDADECYRVLDKDFRFDFLQRAVAGGRMRLVNYLVGKRLVHVDAKKYDDDGLLEDEDTALHVACKEGKPDMVTLLLELGARTEVRNFDRETPLYCAARAQDLESVKLLVEHGAELDATHNGFIDDSDRSETSTNENEEEQDSDSSDDGNATYYTSSPDSDCESEGEWEY